jgi:hypothetical protein
VSGVSLSTYKPENKMNEICETVKIKAPKTEENPEGVVIINKEDQTADDVPFDSADELPKLTAAEKKAVKEDAKLAMIDPPAGGFVPK